MSQMSHEPTEPFPLAEIAMEFLRKGAQGKEPMSFCPQGEEALEVGLIALFSSGKPAAPPLSELLGLATVLEVQRSSPAAAALIRRTIAANPSALRALGINAGDTTSSRRTTGRLLGSSTKDQAPVYGVAAPKGAVSVARLLDPMQMDRARAQKSGPSTSSPASPVKVQPSAGAVRRKFN